MLGAIILLSKSIAGRRGLNFFHVDFLFDVAQVRLTFAIAFDLHSPSSPLSYPPYHDPTVLAGKKGPGENTGLGVTGLCMLLCGYVIHKDPPPSAPPLSPPPLGE